MQSIVISYIYIYVYTYNAFKKLNKQAEGKKQEQIFPSALSS